MADKATNVKCPHCPGVIMERTIEIRDSGPIVFGPINPNKPKNTSVIKRWYCEACATVFQFLPKV